MKTKQICLMTSSDLSSLSEVKTAGSQYLCGFPFAVLAKCLQFFEISCVYKAFQNIL